MGQPVCHFEIIGRDPAKLRGYYAELFGWEFQTGDVATDHPRGGAPLPNVEAALAKAESLGGKRRMGPEGHLIGVAGTE